MHAATRMDPEDILLSEINQMQKGKYCIVLFIWDTQSGQILKDRK